MSILFAPLVCNCPKSSGSLELLSSQVSLRHWSSWGAWGVSVGGSSSGTSAVGFGSWASHLCYKLASNLELRFTSEEVRSVRVFILGLGGRLDRSGVWGFACLSGE
jgi:hypothetical protein